MLRLPGTLTGTIIITIIVVQMPAIICGIRLTIIRPTTIPVHPAMLVRRHHRVEAAVHLQVPAAVRL